MLKNKSFLYIFLLLAVMIVCLIAVAFHHDMSLKKERDSKGFHQTMYCVEVLEDGTAVPAEPFVFQAELFNSQYGERRITMEFTVAGLTITTSHHSTPPTLYAITNGHLFSFSAGMDKGSELGKSARLVADENFKFFQIRTDNRLFVACVHEDFDYSAVLSYIDQHYKYHGPTATDP